MLISDGALFVNVEKKFNNNLYAKTEVAICLPLTLCLLRDRDVRDVPRQYFKVLLRAKNDKV